MSTLQGYNGGMHPLAHLTLLVIVWILYGIIHSVLASRTCKTWFKTRFPDQFRGYRLAFNLFSLALLVPPLWLLLSYPGEPLWQWPVVVGWLLNLAALAAVAGFISTLGMYDSGEFFGIRQWRNKTAEVDDQAPMSLCWAHRFVRHPWYFFLLVLIWTREMNAAFLLSAVVLTLYLVVGSRLEEHKLVLQYGEPYRRYIERVPGLVPLPWRYLRRRQVSEVLGSDRPQP